MVVSIPTIGNIPGLNVVVVLGVEGGGATCPLGFVTSGVVSGGWLKRIKKQKKDKELKVAMREGERGRGTGI